MFLITGQEEKSAKELMEVVWIYLSNVKNRMGNICAPWEDSA